MIKRWCAVFIPMTVVSFSLFSAESPWKRTWLERANNEIYRAGWVELRGGWRPDGTPYLMDSFRGGRVPIEANVPMEKRDYSIGSSDNKDYAAVISYQTSIGGHYWMTDMRCTSFPFLPKGLYLGKLAIPGRGWPLDQKTLDIGMTAEKCWTRPYLSVKDLGKGEIEYAIERGSNKIDIFYSAADDPAWHVVEANPKSSPPKGRVMLDHDYVKKHKKIAIIFEVYKAVAIYTRTYILGEDFAKDQQQYLSLMYPDLKMAAEKPKWWYFSGTYNPRVPEGNGWPVMAPEKEKITLGLGKSVLLKTRTKQVEGKAYVAEKNVEWEILLAPEGCSISKEGEFKAGSEKGIATVRAVLSGWPGVICDMTITIQ